MRMSGIIKKQEIMKKIILTLMMCTAVMVSYAQTDHEDMMNYRRSSLYL